LVVFQHYFGTEVYSSVSLQNVEGGGGRSGGGGKSGDITSILRNRREKKDARDIRNKYRKQKIKNKM